mmetsp:Transcript_121039/g.353715  ORF Transcript_121039/g.353715 Transcript_121039/m.353715 type:complete len:255 (+) Transcript_121039:719-1483(+)
MAAAGSGPPHVQAVTRTAEAALPVAAAAAAEAPAGKPEDALMASAAPAKGRPAGAGGHRLGLHLRPLRPVVGPGAEAVELLGSQSCSLQQGRQGPARRWPAQVAGRSGPQMCPRSLRRRGMVGWWSALLAGRSGGEGAKCFGMDLPPSRWQGPDGGWPRACLAIRAVAFCVVHVCSLPESTLHRLPTAQTADPHPWCCTLPPREPPAGTPGGGLLSAHPPHCQTLPSRRHLAGRCVFHHTAASRTCAWTSRHRS